MRSGLTRPETKPIGVRLKTSDLRKIARIAGRDGTKTTAVIRRLVEERLAQMATAA